MRRCPPGQAPVGSNLCSGGLPPVDYYFHRDDNYNVIAATDAFGNVVERYDYDDFGRPWFLTPAGAPATHVCPASPAGTCSAVGNPYLFTGREYDAESGLYYYRTRYLDPVTGRFQSRDSIGIWGDSSELGNAFAYSSNSPWTYLDPIGTEKIEVDGEFWQRYEQESKTPNSSPHQARGDHYIGPNGQRYYPELGKILDKNGKWHDAPKKFAKRFKQKYDAYWRTRGPGPIRWGAGAASAFLFSALASKAGALEIIGDILRELVAAIHRGDIKEAERLAAKLRDRLAEKGFEREALEWDYYWEKVLLPKIMEEWRKMQEQEPNKYPELAPPTPNSPPVPVRPEPAPNPTRPRRCE
jgi:RHS repeat-associated protein